MLVQVLKSKIHRATITDTVLHYDGSLTVDETLIRAAGMLPNEKVQVVNLNNGSRMDTYLIVGPADSGQICLNGPAARLGQPGDLVIILAYGLVNAEEATSHKPIVIKVDEKNRLRP